MYRMRNYKISKKSAGHGTNIIIRISPRIFENIRNDPNGIIRGLGETDSRKKPEAKNLVTLSL
jgi:hypothetical protein